MILALVVALALAAAPPPTGDWIVYGDNVEPSSLNWLRATDRPSRQVCRLIADSLIDFDQSFKFVPRLARSFEVAPDGLTLTFHLRPGVTWHDGKPCTAKDVSWTIETMRRLDPQGDQFRATFGPLKEVTTPDDQTVVARYSEPFAGALVGWREALIAPAHIAVDPNGMSAQDRSPVGTGPFRFVRWSPQQEVVLAANESYFNGRPRADRYVHRIVPSIEALRAAAEAGEVDIAGLSTDWVASHPNPDASLPFRLLIYPTSYMEMIYWNVDDPSSLFADPRVRRALTMLLDRPGYINAVHHGIYRPAVTLIDPALWGGDPSVSPWPYDPNAAARLLDEAGVKDRDGDGVRETPRGPASFILLYASVTPEAREIAQILERAGAAAGLKIQPQGLEWSVLRQRLAARQFQAVIHRRRLEPLADPYAYFHSSQIGSGQNLGGYRSERFDKLAEQYRATLDARAGGDLLVQMQKLLHEDEPCTFVAIPGAVVAVHKRLHIPEVTAAGLWNWYPSLLGWWVDPADRKYNADDGGLPAAPARAVPAHPDPRERGSLRGDEVPSRAAVGRH